MVGLVGLVGQTRVVRMMAVQKTEFQTLVVRRQALRVGQSQKADREPVFQREKVVAAVSPKSKVVRMLPPQCLLPTAKVRTVGQTAPVET